MAKTNTPPDSFKDIELSRPLTIDGSEIKVIRMREPKVEDQLAAEEVKGSASAQEIQMFANLCEIAPADIKRLTLRDYKKLQVAYVGFIA